ncbi:ROK family protein, partial [Nocardioides sp.]
LAASAVDHEIGAGPDLVMPVVADQLARLLAAGAPPVLGIGMSLPGVVDSERGVSVDTPVMAGWDGVPLAPYLVEVADAPLFLANDADALARSEFLGHAREIRDLLVLKASTGLGLGVLADGRIVSGALGGAGDLGHTKVPEAAGRPCRCGDVGCLETVAAGWALVARLRDEGRDVDHVRALV